VNPFNVDDLGGIFFKEYSQIDYSVGC
jgi:hypothetical protein